MSDYLGNLAARALNLTEVVLPRVASRFEPVGTAAGRTLSNLNDEQGRQPVKSNLDYISEERRSSTSGSAVGVNPSYDLNGEQDIEKIIPDSSSIQPKLPGNRRIRTIISETRPVDESRSKNLGLPESAYNSRKKVFTTSSIEMKNAEDNQDETKESDSSEVKEVNGDDSGIRPELIRIKKKARMDLGSINPLPKKFAVENLPAKRASITSPQEEKVDQSKSSDTYFEHRSEEIPGNIDIFPKEMHVVIKDHPALHGLESFQSDSFEFSEKSIGLRQTVPGDKSPLESADEAIPVAMKTGISSTETHFRESEPLVQMSAKVPSSILDDRVEHQTSRNPIDKVDKIAQSGEQDSIVPLRFRNTLLKPRTSQVYQEIARETPTNYPQYENEPDIQVTIGRIEVKAAAAPSQIQRRRMPPLMSLDDYLRQRRGGDGK